VLKESEKEEREWNKSNGIATKKEKKKE